MDMELSAICENVMRVFEIENIKDLSHTLYDCVINNKFDKYAEYESVIGNLSQDMLQKVFQYYEADRKEKMQDYTPPTLARFVGKLTEAKDEKTVLDLCAGSGALTIQKWNLNHNFNFVCVELDKKVIPFLLFNLAVRNINATVINGDVLKDEIYNSYIVQKGEKFSTVTITDKTDIPKSDSCISNPPYNIKWQIPAFAQLEPRFSECELPPESNANYAFVLTGLSKCTGKAAFILSNGVLMPNNGQEQDIMKYLVKSNYIDSVILCPDRMFEKTSIGVCIMVIDKRKTATHINFVDMRQTYEQEQREQKGQFGGASHENRSYKKNIKIFSDKQIEKAIAAMKAGADIPMFSKSVSPQTVAENNYILAPSRYIDFEESKAENKHREYAEIVNDINRVISEKNACKLTINESLAKKLGFDISLFHKENDNNETLGDLLKSLGADPLVKANYFATSKNKNEFKFENKSKDTVSSVLVMILQTWKQHIYYLITEENRYLTELRDALLPDLMSGEIIIGEKHERTKKQ